MTISKIELIWNPPIIAHQGLYLLMTQETKFSPFGSPFFPFPTLQCSLKNLGDITSFSSNFSLFFVYPQANPKNNSKMLPLWPITISSSMIKKGFIHTSRFWKDSTIKLQVERLKPGILGRIFLELVIFNGLGLLRVPLYYPYLMMFVYNMACFILIENDNYWFGFKIWLQDKKGTQAELMR